MLTIKRIFAGRYEARLAGATIGYITAERHITGKDGGWFIDAAQPNTDGYGFSIKTDTKREAVQWLDGWATRFS